MNTPNDIHHATFTPTPTPHKFTNLETRPLPPSFCLTLALMHVECTASKAQSTLNLRAWQRSKGFCCTPTFTDIFICTNI